MLQLGERLRLVAMVALAAGLCASTAPAAFTAFETGQVRPLALSPDGTRLYAVNTPDSRLEIFAVGAGGLTPVGSVPVGLEPCAVAARSNAEVWVVNHLSDSVSVVDVASTPPRVTRTLLVGDEPRDIVFAGAAGNRAFITTAHRGQNHPSNPQLTTAGIGRADVWVFDAGNLGATLGGTPLTILTLFGDTPRALAVTPDRSTVYAAVFHSGNRTTTVSEGAVCDTNSTNLGNNTVQGPCTVAGITMPGGLPLPHRSSDNAVRPEVGLIVKHSGSQWLDQLGRDWSPAVRFSLPDRDVFAIDANATPPVQSAFYTGVGTILFNMAVNPVNGKVYVSNGEARNEVRFEGPGVLGGSTVQGRLAEYRITVLDGAAVQPRHLNKHIDYGVRPAPAGVKDHSLATPLDMAVSGNGQTLYVAAFGSSKIGIFDTAQLEADTFTPNSADHVAVSGGGPSGLVLDEARGRLYALTRFDNSLSVIDTTTRSELAHLPLHNPEPASVVEGRPFLYDAHFTSSNGEASCSSCHIFGDLDSLAWDLGNPDDHQTPNPLPIRLETVAQINGTDVDFDNFHPMKGPMTTQTLRGMANHGAMHWRGDRADLNQPFNEDLSFRNFRVAFPGLLGRVGTIPESDMIKFSNFILQVELPPNPIRNLDDSLTPDQQAGRNFMTGSRRSDGIFVGNDFGFNCVGCHTLDPGQGFFGADGQASFENETQILKVAHLRNMYQKVGMFGMAAVSFFNAGDNGFKGDQIRGFGFLHDGSVDTMFRFLQATVFNNGGTFNPVGFQNDTQRRQVEQFLFAFDSDLKPVVGQQVTLTDTNAATVNARINLLHSRAAAGDCDLIVKGTVGGEQRGWLRVAGNNFLSDRSGEPTLSDETLRVFAAVPGQALTYTAVPPGNGVRAGIDRDEDGYVDRDELDAGSDPADPNSTPGAATPTASASVTASATGTGTVTATATATDTATAPPADTSTPTPSPTDTVPAATHTPAPSPTATDTSAPSPTPSETPTASVTPTATPSVTPVTPTLPPTTTPTTTPTPLCAATPRAGCGGAARSILRIKPDGPRPQLAWRWVKGSVPTASLGNPVVSTSYALCVYDSQALVPGLAIEIEIEPSQACSGGQCWKALGQSTLNGFRYKDANRSQSGAEKVLLKGGRPGRDKILFKASGATLPLPAAAGAGQYFAHQDDVTVQLVNDTGSCWETVFSPVHASRNRPDLYKAKR